MGDLPYQLVSRSSEPSTLCPFKHAVHLVMADFVANLKHIYSIKEGWLTSNLKETKSRTPFQFSPHTTPRSKPELQPGSIWELMWIWVIFVRVCNIFLYQWSFLVPLIGGRYHIIAQLAVYTTYIPLIYCQLGDYMVPSLPPIKGTRKLHWL